MAGRTFAIGDIHGELEQLRRLMSRLPKLDADRGKRVVFGHTTTDLLPPELSQYTPDDPKDLWAYENVIGIDTGCGRGGFLTAIELPSLTPYESR